jgi:hypothetical protein
MLLMSVSRTGSWTFSGERRAEIRIGGFVHADGNGMGRIQTAIGALDERHTRYVMLFPLPDGNIAEAARDALTETVQRLPDHL